MKKKKIVLIFSISIIMILVLLVMAMFFGGYNATILPQINDEMIEKANQEARQNELAKKEQFFREHEGDNVEKEQVSTDTTEDFQAMQEEQAQEDFNNKIIGIMSQYYPDFTATVEQIEKENSGLQLINVNEPLSNANVKFYDMILTVLEEQSLSSDDREALIELITGLYDNIEKDDGLCARANSILNQN